MIRALLLAAALGLVACGTATPVTPSCTPQSCAGCCGADDTCQEGISVGACGLGGLACQACAAGQPCSGQRCGGAAGGGSGGGGGGGAGGGAGLPSWQDETVRRHNHQRSIAAPAPSPALAAMTWSPSAQATAEAWAANCRFEHNTAQNSFGENLYASTNEPTPTQVVDDWASEKADYDYATNRCATGKACGHYTQVVWRSSTGVGCARVRCTANSPFGSGAWTLWVCNYAPPGNYVGQKPY